MSREALLGGEDGMAGEGALLFETPNVLDAARDAIVDTAGPTLVGLYLCGSLVSGGFDPRVSDIDLIAALSRDPSDDLVSRLGRMHDLLARSHPNWAERIEVVYVSGARLRKLQERIPRMAVISPGEPFHVVSAGPEWLLTWYSAREEAVALLGPALADVIPEIPQEEFLAAVRERLKELRTGCQDEDSPGACAYAILTTCRGLYTLEFGSRPSKLAAAEWVASEYPEWVELIASALQWRQLQWGVRTPDPAVVAATRRFLQGMAV